MSTNRVVSKGVKGGYVTAIFESGGHVQLNSANTTVSANSAGETVNEMWISTVMVAAANAVTYTVKRGGNTVLQLSGVATFKYQDAGIQLETGGESAANVVVTKNGAGVASLVVKLHKRTSVTGGSQY